MKATKLIGEIFSAYSGIVKISLEALEIAGIETKEFAVRFYYEISGINYSVGTDRDGLMRFVRRKELEK